MHTIPIKTIKLFPNVRSGDDAYKGKTFDGLVDSIRANGILQPLLVRPLGKHNGNDAYELVSGYRRYYAAVAAAIVVVPVHVRNLDDSGALAARVVENLQREDVHPLDEANAIEDMVTDGLALDAVASRLGKSLSYVTKHVTLVNLDDTLARWFRENRLGVGDAIKLARLMPDIQADIVKDIRRDQGRNPTNIHPDWLIQQHHLSLGNAEFDTKDAELGPAAGSCKASPKRTRNPHTHFGDAEAPCPQVP